VGDGARSIPWWRGASAKHHLMVELGQVGEDRIMERRHWGGIVGIMGVWFCAGLATAQSDQRAAAVNLPDFREVVRGATDRVFPAVVYVKCIRENFEQGKKQSQEVSGSGVLISPSGEALTNWHVVDKAVEVRCLLYDGRALNAHVVGHDKDTDLAMLQLESVEKESEFPWAVIGESGHLREGDFVMAMGAPWGLSRSVSIGIISCTRRYLPEASEYSLWLQSDCAISPGNSGGPLVNTAGEVVGINARGHLWGGDMAFAVPAETVKFIVDQLRAHGKVRWSWTGLQLQPLRDFNRNTYFDGSDGVIVAETDKESPARHAGVQPRDRILKINGQPVAALTEEDLPAVRHRLGLLPVGEPVELSVRRGGQELMLRLTPREKGKVEGDEYDCKRWDMTVKTINQFDNPTLYFHRTEGVYVFAVKRPGNAARARLAEQDIILEIGGQEIRTLEDIERCHKAALESIDDNHRIALTVLRHGMEQQFVLDFSRDFERE
jgi:serine protease Do